MTGLLPALRREVNEMDPNLALYYVEMLDERVKVYTASDRFYLLLLGLFAGLAAALAGGRVLSSLLFEVEPWDPLTFVGGTGLLLCVAFAATLLPARWATKIPPTEAMRVE
jgi:ABC-type lipoprotein release transport system permease subunit